MSEPEPTTDRHAGIVEVGPRPTGSPVVRWVRRADVPDEPLPLVLEYSCRKRAEPLIIDGDVDRKPWPWSAPFGHIATGDPVEHLSRAAFLWDDEYLYAAFDFVDPAREAISTEPGTHVYVYDTAAEVLLAAAGGAGGYYEIGINSIGTGYEIAWQWIEPLFDAGDKEAIDRLFRIPNFLYFAPQGTHRLGRVGDLDARLTGLEHAARWSDRQGTPGWTAELAFPWSSLAPILGLDSAPAPGLELRIQAYRAHHHDADPAAVARLVETHGKGASPLVGWTWSVQGNNNVHNLERWALVTLSSDTA